MSGAINTSVCVFLFLLCIREGWEAKALLNFFDSKLKAQQKISSRGRRRKRSRSRSRSYSRSRRCVPSCVACVQMGMCCDVSCVCRVAVVLGATHRHTDGHHAQPPHTQDHHPRDHDGDRDPGPPLSPPYHQDAVLPLSNQNLGRL